MDRGLWLGGFRLDRPPGWPCGRCGRGQLFPVATTFRAEETADSRAARGELAWDPDWITERFVGYLRCSQPACQDWAAVAGTVRYTMTDTLDDPGYDVVAHHHPSTVAPPPPLIRVPGTCPDEVVEELRRAFALYWGDPGACAGRIRAALERLVDHFRVPATYADKHGQRRRASLHARLEAFGRRRGRAPVVAPLLATKVVGNAGAHGDELRAEDALDAFELVEHVLEEVFDQRSARLAKLGKAVSRRHGSR